MPSSQRRPDLDLGLGLGAQAKGNPFATTTVGQTSNFNKRSRSAHPTSAPSYGTLVVAVGDRNIDSTTTSSGLPGSRVFMS